MYTSRFVAFLAYAVLFSIMSSCATVDRVSATKFEPVRKEEGAQIFKFTAFADAAYPLDSEEAERIRIGWLETWLHDNGYDSKKYEVISRVPVIRNKGILSTVYDIYYEIRVIK